MYQFIFNMSMRRSRAYFCKKYGEKWYNRFERASKHYFQEVLPQLPDIGKSIFTTNYRFAPAYIAWYKALRKLGLSAEQINMEIWKINELFMKTLPSWMLKLSGKVYLNSFRKNAIKHEARQKQGKLHPYDWKIHFHTIDSNRFEIDIVECAYKKLADQFQVQAMLPGICRMDYLMASLMGNGFTRTKTLGDGDDCCNCKYAIVGKCEWAPEKGFIDRK